MSRSRTESSVFATICYWFGILLSVGCLALILTGNTEVIWRYEHTGIPVSWVAGMCAILAFLAFEYFESRSPATPSASLEFSADAGAREPELS